MHHPQRTLVRLSQSLCLPIRNWHLRCRDDELAGPEIPHASRCVGLDLDTEHIVLKVRPGFRASPSRSISGLRIPDVPRHLIVRALDLP